VPGLGRKGGAGQGLRRSSPSQNSRLFVNARCICLRAGGKLCRLQLARLHAGQRRLRSGVRVGFVLHPSVANYIHWMGHSATVCTMRTAAACGGAHSRHVSPGMSRHLLLSTAAAAQPAARQCTAAALKPPHHTARPPRNLLHRRAQACTPVPGTTRCTPTSTAALPCVRHICPHKYPHQMPHR
jgi:hypothetical protein